MDLEKMTREEILELRAKIDEILARTQETKYRVELGYNQYKGSGKCWVAKVGPDTKKILGFIDAESVIKRDNYSGRKVFLLPDGHYLFNEEGSKKSDSRRYVRIENGEEKEF